MRRSCELKASSRGLFETAAVPHADHQRASDAHICFCFLVFLYDSTVSRSKVTQVTCEGACSKIKASACGPDGRKMPESRLLSADHRS